MKTPSQTPPYRLNKRLLLIIGGLLIALVALLSLTPLTTEHMLTWGAGISRHPLAPPLIMMTMALLMSFGLPGSMCFWLIAPFHPPLAATAMLVVGSCAGSIGGYFVGAKLRAAAPPNRIGQQITALLTRRSDLLTQISLRMLPGFPHVLVNFTSGILKLPLATFISAAVIGLTIKWAVYSNAVYGVASSHQADDALSLSTLMPLAVLGAMVLISGQFRRSTQNKRLP